MWQNAHCRSTDGRHADDVDASPREVLIPLVPPRMKQLCNAIRFWIDASQVRTFVQITIDTGKSEVVEFVAAMVKPRNDMLNVENSER